MNRIPIAAMAFALLVFLSASARLGALGKGDPPHADVVLEGGVPATLFLPEPGPMRAAFAEAPPVDEQPPGVVLMHGFSGDRVAMSGLSRRLATAGYAVLAFDARGHGRNRNPFLRSWASPDPFYPDLRAAVDFLRFSNHVDGSRIVVMGHSMGGSASLDYATRDSGIDGAVLISGGSRVEGPYRPANALFVYAAGDPERVKKRLDRVAARIVGKESIETGRTYGDLANGTAVRVVEIAGADHATIVWSEAAAGEILSWLDAIFGREPGPVPPDPRLPVLLVVVLTLPFLYAGLGSAVGRFVPSWPEESTRGAGVGFAMLAASLVLVMPILSVGVPGAILSAEVGDLVVSHLGLAGILVLLVLALRGADVGSLLRNLGPALPGAAVAMLGVFLTLLPLGAVVHGLHLTPERAFVLVAGFAGLLPFALAFQVLLRRGPPVRATLLAIAGRVLVLVVLYVGVVAGVVPSAMTVMFPALAITFALFELLASSLYAASRNLAAVSLVDAAWLALVFAAILPVRI